jgi:hypothetical protein
MPYIKLQRRLEIAENHNDDIKTPGELNYAISVLLRDYVNAHGLNYVIINDIVGALEGAKLEFYRRVAAPYEDTKIKENGDVY